MHILKACVIAVAMYSKLPMPAVEWNEKNMKYAMCFFPLVGVVIGALQFAAIRLLTGAAGCGVFLSAVILTLLPVLITGGIHLDGFADVMDALCSYGDREKKLEILKDPRTGAFAVIGLCGWFLLYTGLWSGFFEHAPVWPEDPDTLMRFAAQSSCIFVLSRALSGCSVVSFPPARKTGLLSTFRDRAQKGRVRLVLLLWAAAAAAVMFLADPVPAAAAVLTGLAVFYYYYRISLRQFGGTTGDLAGYFLQICETCMLAALLISGGWLYSPA